MRIFGITLFVAVVLYSNWEASAQQRRARVDRPSEQTGSTLLGRIGGAFTRTTAAPESIRGNRSAPTEITTPLALPGLGPRRGSGFYAGALSVGSATFVQRRNPALFSIGQMQIAQARQLSGLTHATDPRADTLRIQQLNRLPGLTTPVYLREAGGTTFHAVFGLTPAGHQSEKTVEVFPSDLRQHDLMHANVAAREQALINRALQAFTQAMDDRPLTERLEALKDAEGRLRTAAALNISDSEMELNLCLLHLGLEIEQIGASSVLIDAALRANPRLFVDRATIASRMGDYDPEQGTSRQLDQHFRRYVVTAGYNPTSLEAHLLTGYCAVYMNDWRRLQAAVDEVQAQLHSIPDREPLDRFLWAVRPILEQRP